MVKPVRAGAGAGAGAGIGIGIGIGIPGIRDRNRLSAVSAEVAGRAPAPRLSLSPVYSSEFLGLCSLPGCRFKDVRRNLQKDIGESSGQCISASHFRVTGENNMQLDKLLFICKCLNLLAEELKNYGTQDIFVLCTRGELFKYRVPNLIDTYQQHGICVHHYPIPDGDAPDIAMCCKILEELRSCLESNRKTIIHCYGGLGRSCLIAACLLLWLSDALAPQQAIDSLRNLRGSGAIQTIKYRALITNLVVLFQQYNYLHDFRENLAAHLATKDTILRSVSR
ncbi:hypothetical protein QYF61_004337 [Mycteria americana]|uniref:Cyclin-dependent kinase inhibitor 3 n=1 Tax=Mycteria americana TaxID=33587 RepID=A0AAN7NTU4_MYCAM|nr:hypothetical protein QYF61_004337 [Mycteria americana]